MNHPGIPLTLLRLETGAMARQTRMCVRTKSGAWLANTQNAVEPENYPIIRFKIEALKRFQELLCAKFSFRGQ